MKDGLTELNAKRNTTIKQTHIHIDETSAQVRSEKRLSKCLEFLVTTIFQSRPDQSEKLEECGGFEWVISPQGRRDCGVVGAGPTRH